MGFSIDQLFGDAKRIAEQGMGDLYKQGGAAALGWLEQQAIDLLQKDKNQHEEFLKQTITKNLETPSSPGSFGSYLSNLAAQPVIKEYGPYIAIAVGVIVAGTLILSKGK